MILIQLSGENFSPVDLTDIAERVVQPPLQVLPGAAQAIISGARRYAIRVWLDPVRMAARGIDAFDVRRAIQQSNLQLPAGQLEAAARKFTINADAGLTNHQEPTTWLIGAPTHPGCGTSPSGALSQHSAQSSAKKGSVVS